MEVAFCICREFLLENIFFQFFPSSSNFFFLGFLSMNPFDEVVCQLLIFGFKLPDMYYLIFYHSFFGSQLKLSFIRLYINFYQLVFSLLCCCFQNALFNYVEYVLGHRGWSISFFELVPEFFWRRFFRRQDFCYDHLTSQSAFCSFVHALAT